MRTASGEQKVISLITAQLFLVMGDVAIRSETEVEFTCADTEKGWKEIQDWIMGSKTCSEDSENDEERQLGNADTLAYFAKLSKGESYPLQNSKLEEGKTTPKKHFTDVIHFESRQWKYSKCKGAG